MRKKLRIIRVSPAMVVAVVALLAATAGTAVGQDAVTAAKKLVTGKQIKNGSVTGKDINNGSLTGKDFAGGGGPKGGTGSQGPVGTKGAAGAQGPAGPKGADGAKGAAGGVAGPTGQRGPTGPTGPKGPAVVDAYSGFGPANSTSCTTITNGTHFLDCRAVPGDGFYIVHAGVDVADNFTNRTVTCSLFSNEETFSTAVQSVVFADPNQATHIELTGVGYVAPGSGPQTEYVGLKCDGSGLINNAGPAFRNVQFVVKAAELE